jgi:hypothetical protein
VSIQLVVHAAVGDRPDGRRSCTDRCIFGSSAASSANRHGNRRLNSALHNIAVVQGRCHSRVGAYLQHTQAAGDEDARDWAGRPAVGAGQIRHAVSRATDAL